VGVSGDNNPSPSLSSYHENVIVMLFNLTSKCA
jgi:hypothetical protein